MVWKVAKKDGKKQEVGRRTVRLDKEAIISKLNQRSVCEADRSDTRLNGFLERIIELYQGHSESKDKL